MNLRTPTDWCECPTRLRAVPAFRSKLFGVFGPFLVPVIEDVYCEGDGLAFADKRGKCPSWAPPMWSMASRLATRPYRGADGLSAALRSVSHQSSERRLERPLESLLWYELDVFQMFISWRHTVEVGDFLAQNLKHTRIPG